MQKQNIIVVLLLVMALFVGGAMAVDVGTTTGQTAGTYINGALAVPSYTVTVPVTIDISLNRVSSATPGNINGVYIASDVPWKLTVSSTKTNMYLLTDSSKSLKNTFEIELPGWAAFYDLSAPRDAFGEACSNTPVTITYRQLIDPQDIGGAYQIPLTFTVTPQVATP